MFPRGPTFRNKSIELPHVSQSNVTAATPPPPTHTHTQTYNWRFLWVKCCDLLRPFAWNHNNVGTCCVQFENGPTFGPPSPNIFIVLWPAKRSATMLRPFAWNPNNVGLVKTSAHAPCNIFFFKKQTIVMRFLLSGLLQLRWANNLRKHQTFRQKIEKRE